MNPAVGFPFNAIPENLGGSFPHPLDLPLGFEEKCILLSRRPYFPKFHGNHLPSLVPIQGTKAAPGRCNRLDH